MFGKLGKHFSEGNYVARTSLAEAFEVSPCLHCCHLSVRLLCPFPGFFFSNKGLKKFVLFWISVLLSIPFLSLFLLYFPFLYYLSLWSMFLCSLFSSLSTPYLRVCFLACLASSSSLSIDKSHMGVSVELLATPSQVPGCIGGRASAKQPASFLLTNQPELQAESVCNHISIQPDSRKLFYLPLAKAEVVFLQFIFCCNYLIIRVSWIIYSIAAFL